MRALYALRDSSGATYLYIDGWTGWVSIRLNTFGYYTLTLRQPGNRISYTGMAGNADVVRSVAEAMIRGAARADGIEARA